MNNDHDDLSKAPQEYAVSFTVLVSSDSFMELRKRVTALQSLIPQALKSNPNKDGYYISVDDIHSNIKPPISEHSSDVG